MLNIKLIIKEKQEEEKIITWLKEFVPGCFVISNEGSREKIDIFFYEVNHLFDWVKISRIQKKKPNSMIFPVISPRLTYFFLLAIELQLQSVLFKPLQRNKFLRTAKKIRPLYEQKKRITFTYSDLYEEMDEGGQTPFREVFLRRLLRGEVVNDNEFLDARSFLSATDIPNIVLLIQGFKQNQNLESEKSNICSIVKRCIREQFVGKTSVSLLCFQKYLLLLMKVPDDYSSLKRWKKGEEQILEVITKLQVEHGISIYIGVGDVYQEPLQIHQSYGQARKARRMPPVDNVHLRYHEDLTQNPHIQKAIQYIEDHYHEEIVICDVAKQINFSPTYFSRMFKKKTGRSFVEYMTFVRLQKTLPLLRKTDYTVEAISSNCGFNTPNYYSSIFKKYVGLTPSEYRNTREIIFK